MKTRPNLLALAWPVLATVVSVLGAVALAGLAKPSALLDPGPVVRWGLPVLRALQDLSTATAIGALVFACFALGESKTLARVLNLVALSAGLWAVTGGAALVFTYLSVTGSKFSAGADFGQQLWLFITQVQYGQYLAINLLVAIAVSTLALVVSRLSWVLAITVLAFFGLLPLALSGHAAGTAGHSMAVNALGLHLVGVSIWVGGLIALWVSGRGAESATRQLLTRRFSSLALAAFVLVAVSGIASATLRLNLPADLGSKYGLLVVAKSALLMAMGAMGALYRLRLIRLGKSIFQLIVAELILMGTAMGLAAALARTAPPKEAVISASPTPAELLTGDPLPPELTPLRWITSYKIDLVWLLVCLVGIGFYVWGVLRLHRRKDKWPITRTLSWVTGMLTLLYITNGSMNLYEPYLFSVHMISHMMLTMAVPVLLVPGAPITLLMRAVEKRKDDSRGVREWALWAVHTKWAQFVSHPIVAAINFASSLVVFYFTPIFGWATREHIGHEWMIVHFLITGYLFVQALVGIDPGPKRLGYPIRLMLLIGTLTFHAFFGLALMQGDSLILADWYGAMARTWGETPLADQKTGGAIAWGVGELPAAVLTLVVSIQWSRSDARETRRLDRASDRNSGADIDEYNQMLAKLAARDERRG